MHFFNGETAMDQTATNIDFELSMVDFATTRPGWFIHLLGLRTQSPKAVDG